MKPFPLILMLAFFFGVGPARADTGLFDAVAALQVAAGTAPRSTGADIDHDGRLGLPEASYALQVATGLRPTDDPLFFHQWHLWNAGQRTFSPTAGTPGEDLRMTRAMADGLTGLGVIVAVVDSGLEIAHEDLSGNVIAGGSYNFFNQSTDPTATTTDGDHGTSVAGIIAAAAKNGNGGRGVAPGVGLKGFNAQATSKDTDFFASLGGSPLSADVQIFNMSYGDDDIRYAALPPLARDLYAASQDLRGGKGAIYVKSAGNGYQTFEMENGTLYTCRTDSAYPAGIQNLDVTCQNAVAEGENARPELIVVGAYNASGKKASYSSTGAALWISAPGGEHGSDAPAIVTPDQSGCDKGYSRSRHLYTGAASPANDFETGEAAGDGRYNPGCNYTSAFNGTSSAAPNVSGAIALILEVNPALTRRDVKHILAKTARRIDPDIAAKTVTIGAKPYVAEPAWVTNAAGYYFHNWYGFGAIDVDAAIAMALAYPSPSPLGAMVQKSHGGTLATGLSVPDADADGVVYAITVPDADDLIIESVIAEIAIDHPNTGEIATELTSPAGTRSVVLTLRSALKSGLYTLAGQPPAVVPAAMATNAFYGEGAKGVWTLRIVDGVAGNTGTLKHAAVVISGH